MRENLVNEIIKNALIKYKYKNKIIMNTYISNALIKNKCTPEEAEKIENTINFYIETQKEQQKRDFLEETQKDVLELQKKLKEAEKQKENQIKNIDKFEDNETEKASWKNYNEKTIEKTIEAQKKRIIIEQNDAGASINDYINNYILSFNTWIFEKIKDQYIKNNYFLPDETKNDYIINKYKIINDFLIYYINNNILDHNMESKELIANVIDPIYFKNVNANIKQIEKIERPNNLYFENTQECLNWFLNTETAQQIRKNSRKKLEREKKARRERNKLIFLQFISDLLK